MSGIIDDEGQQWEHCCHCGNFTRIQDLVTGYSPKWPDYPWVDLCKNCKSKLKPVVYDIDVDDNYRIPTILKADIEEAP